MFRVKMGYIEDIISSVEKGNSFEVAVRNFVVERDRSDGSTRREITVSTGDRVYPAKNYWADENEAREDSAAIISGIKSELDRHGIRYKTVSLDMIAVNPVGLNGKEVQAEPCNPRSQYSAEEIEALKMLDYTALEASIVTPAVESDLVREFGQAHLSYSRVLAMGIRMGQSEEETVRKMMNLHGSKIKDYLQGPDERLQAQAGKAPEPEKSFVQGTLFDMDNLS